MRHVDPRTAAADATPADPALADPHGTAHALVERQLQMLTRLAEMGMQIAEATERWALAAMDGDAASPVPSEVGLPALPVGFRGDPGLVYSRVARAVRLTLMLQTRLLKDLPALGRAETQAQAARAEARHSQAHRLVERAIRAEHDDADDVEQLSGDAWERLRDEDLGDDLAGRPLAEVVARICRDLGLSPDWGARTLESAMGCAGAPAPPEPMPPAPVRPRRSRAWPANADPPPRARPGPSRGDHPFAGGPGHARE